MCVHCTATSIIFKDDHEVSHSLSTNRRGLHSLLTVNNNYSVHHKQEFHFTVHCRHGSVVAQLGKRGGSIGKRGCSIGKRGGSIREAWWFN
jgi:hypothetical protein